MRFFALFVVVLVGFGVLTQASEDGNLRKLADPLDCDINKVDFFMIEEGTFFTTSITNGAADICFRSSRVTFEAFYFECDVEGDTIKKVELEHFVNGKRISKRTERKIFYYLYGDTVDGIINFRTAIEGETKITAKANRGTTQEVNFTLRKCL